MITKGTNLRLDNSGKMQAGPPMGQMQSQQQQQQQQMQPQKPMSKKHVLKINLLNTYFVEGYFYQI